MKTVMKIRNAIQRLYGWYIAPMKAIVCWDYTTQTWYLKHDGQEVAGHRYQSINDTVESARAEGWRLQAF